MYNINNQIKKETNNPSTTETNQSNKKRSYVHIVTPLQPLPNSLLSVFPITLSPS